MNLTLRRARIPMLGGVTLSILALIAPASFSAPAFAASAALASAPSRTAGDAAGTKLAQAGGTSSDVIAKRGTEIDGVLEETLDSKTAQDGQRFQLKDHETFFHRDPALKGATIDGHVENVTPASPTHKATMNVIFDDVVLPNGQVAPIQAKVLSVSEFEPKSHKLRTVGLVVGGAVAGHYLGKRTGHKHGGLAGAAAGYALSSAMKSNIVVRKGSIVKLRLTQDLVPETASGAPSSG